MRRHGIKDNKFSQEKVQSLFRDKNYLNLNKDWDTKTASC